MNTLLFIIQLLLIIMFAFSAASKFLRTKTMVQHWNEYRYPSWLMQAIAALETAGMAGIMAGFWYPELIKYAAALIAVLMLGAIHAHLFRAKHKPYMAINAILMLGVSVVLLLR